MKYTSKATELRHRPILYGIAFGVFAILLTLRESEAFGYVFKSLPILGGNIPFFTLAIMLAYAYRISGGRLSDIGLSWPSWSCSRRMAVIRITVAGVLIFLARALVATSLGPVLDEIGPRPDTLARMAPLVNNLDLLLLLLPLMWLAVMGEELLFRGFVMNFLASRFDGTAKAWGLAIIISAILFGVGHFWQGPRGMIASGAGALVMGAGYYLVGRNLWPTILAHSLGNTLGFFSVYLSD